MKISHRTHPNLEIIERGRFSIHDIIRVKPKDYDAILRFFKDNIESYRKPVILSKAMIVAVESAREKMIQDEAWNNVGTGHGTILLGDLMFCYNIYGEGEDVHTYGVYVFGQGQLIAYLYQLKESDYRLFYVPNTWPSASGEVVYGEDIGDGLFTTLMSAINFLRYAEVQDKVIPAKSKIRNGIKGKDVNDTGLDVTFVTSHYITNLVVTGAFKVSGHWRMQPKKKDGEWTRELIWINEFQKSGYHRKAGILDGNVIDTQE